MSFENVLALQAKEVYAFARTSRKRLVLATSMTDESLDSTHSIAWTFGPIVQITLGSFASSIDSRQTGIMSPAPDRASINSNEFFLDEAAGILYVSDSNFDVYGNPMFNGGAFSAGVFYVEHLSYFATEELPFFENPESEFSPVVKWEEGILEIPSVARSVADNYSGYSPSEISPLVIAHNGVDLWDSLYDDSFLNCSAEVWICTGPLRPENCRKVFTGKILNMVFDDRKITFELIENSGLLEGAYEGRYYSGATGFTAVDPSFEGSCIPIAFGSPRWVRAVNIDYIKEGAATTNNRIWGIYDVAGMNGGTMSLTLGTVTSLGGGLYSSTGMAEAEVRALSVDDYVRRFSDSLWCRVDAILSPTSIRLATITATPLTGQSFQRPAVQEMFFQIPSKQGTVLQWRAYETVATVSSSVVNDVESLVMTNDFENQSFLTLGIVLIDPDDFEVWVRIAGANHASTYEGTHINSLGGGSEIMCLYWYLKTIIGLNESEIDGQSFIDAEAVRPISNGTAPLGLDVAYFTHPMWAADFETHKSVVTRLLQQIGAIAYFDRYGAFTLVLRGVMGDSDFEITDNDISGVPQFEIRHDDIRAFNLDGNCVTIGAIVTTTKTKPSTTTTTIRNIGGPTGENVSNKYARARGILNTETVQLYDIGKDSQAAGYYLYRAALQRMANYFGDRRLVVSFKGGGEILDAEPGDIVTLRREFIPGEPFVEDQLQSRKFFILSVEKLGALARITMEDQHSIEQIGSF